MSERITLPSGNWVELRDYRELRRGDKKRAVGAIQDTEKVIAAGYDVADGLLVLLVTNWSYDLPIPSTSPESLDLLPLEDDDALMGALTPAMRALFPNSQPKTAAEAQAALADPASPTGPSAA